MYHRHNIESKTIKWSVIVLCISLIMVYVILYYAKGDLWKLDITMTNQDVNDIQISELNILDEEKHIDTGDKLEIDFDTGLLLDYIETGNNQPNTGSTVTGNQIVTGSLTNIQSGIQINSGSDQEEMLILSGTRVYYGELDFVDKLGISYKYALTDDKNIFYVNMGSYKYDFSDIARKLKGSLYVINTDQEIISNALFGDKVTFINIPEYKNKKVLLLLDINNQSWLLAIDYSIYHQVKSYLKSLFIY